MIADGMVIHALARLLTASYADGLTVTEADSMRATAALARAEHDAMRDRLVALEAKSAPMPSVTAEGPYHDLRCHECGDMMTSHVVQTRHASGTCNESVTGPELTAGPSSSATDYDALEGEALADPVVRAAYRENLTKRVQRETIEACARLFSPLATRYDGETVVARILHQLQDSTPFTSPANSSETPNSSGRSGSVAK